MESFFAPYTILWDGSHALDAPPNKESPMKGDHSWSLNPSANPLLPVGSQSDASILFLCSRDAGFINYMVDALMILCVRILSKKKKRIPTHAHAQVRKEVGGKYESMFDDHGTNHSESVVNAMRGPPTSQLCCRQARCMASA